MIVVLTIFTLMAFAANSLLCRMALGGNLIDPVSFTTVRLASGALALIPLSRLLAGSEDRQKAEGGSWGSGIALFAYAAAFSLAYVSLSTGMGALILFPSVQVTMICAALKSGERLSAVQWGGLITALAGLVFLMLPGASAPNPGGAVLMCLAGVAWGVYSIRGKGTPAPVLMTSGNFLRSVPFAAAGSVIAVSSIHLERAGVLLALVSGVVTSGLGYVLWYRIMRSLTTTQAAVLQLLVPALAAFGGVALLSERVSPRLIAASALILGGVAGVVLKRNEG
jgi:drug/metabolite transporter (DMT)-like permease